MHRLVEGVMHVYQGELPMSSRDDEQGGRYVPVNQSKLIVVHPKVAAAYLHKLSNARL